MSPPVLAWNSSRFFKVTRALPPWLSPLAVTTTVPILTFVSLSNNSVVRYRRLLELEYQHQSIAISQFAIILFQVKLNEELI